MALTPSYDHNSTMKSINVGGSVYWLKDNDLRGYVEGFSDAVFKSVDTTFDDESTNLPTGLAIATWVNEQIADLEGAMHFRGVITRQTGETDAEAIARVITNPEAGDVVVMSDNGKEYIYASTTAGWKEVGDELIYETSAHAAATYVPKTTTIAGIALSGNISAESLSGADALNLKALSHKDSATGSVTTADSINSFTTGAAGTYDVTSATTVSVPQTFSALDVTPAGSVTVTADTAAAATYDKATSVTVASGAVGEGQTANYTPAGTISLPSLTASVTLGKEAVAVVTDAGTGYTISDGAVSQGADTTAAFIKKGVQFAMDTTDTEQLNISYVTDTTDTGFFSDAVTASGTVSYTKQTLSGALPTFSTKDVATSVSSATASYSGDATFSGTGTILTATPSFTTTAATVTQPTFTASFSGTANSVTPTAATTADAIATATVTVDSETITPTLVTTSKTVTVS